MIRRRASNSIPLLLVCGALLGYQIAVYPSKREVATPREQTHKARLGVRNDLRFLYDFCGDLLVCTLKAKTHIALNVEVSDARDDDKSAKAGDPTETTSGANHSHFLRRNQM